MVLDYCQQWISMPPFEFVRCWRVRTGNRGFSIAGVISEYSTLDVRSIVSGGPRRGKTRLASSGWAERTLMMEILKKYQMRQWMAVGITARPKPRKWKRQYPLPKVLGIMWLPRVAHKVISRPLWLFCIPSVFHSNLFGTPPGLNHLGSSEFAIPMRRVLPEDCNPSSNDDSLPEVEGLSIHQNALTNARGDMIYSVGRPSLVCKI